MSANDKPWEKPPKGVARIPRNEWGNWRAKRDRKIASPRRNKAALQLTQPKKPEETDNG